MKEHTEIIDLELARTGECEGVIFEHLDSCEECRLEAEELGKMAESLSGALHFDEKLRVSEDVDDFVRSNIGYHSLRINRSRRLFLILNNPWTKVAAAVALMAAMWFVSDFKFSAHRDCCYCMDLKDTGARTRLAAVKLLEEGNPAKTASVFDYNSQGNVVKTTLFKIDLGINCNSRKKQCIITSSREIVSN